MALQEKIQLYYNRLLDILDGKLKASYPGETENFDTGWWDWVDMAWKIEHGTYNGIQGKYFDLMAKRDNHNLSDTEIAALWNATGLNTTKPKAYHPAGGIQDRFPSNANPMGPDKKSFRFLKDLAYNTDEASFNKCVAVTESDYHKIYHSRIHRFAATFNSNLLDVYNGNRFNMIDRWFQLNDPCAIGDTKHDTFGDLWFQKSLDLQKCINSMVTCPDKYSKYEKQYISRLFGCYLWWFITENGRRIFR